jgi:hypothetical protein
MKIQEQTITPELAKEYLLKTKLNRRLSETNVNYLFIQMKQGNWMQTADCIKFGTDGSLLDGQHRLSAIVKLGEPVKMMVAEGLKPEVFTVLDTGKSRSAADVLAASNFKAAHNLAALARAIILYKAGRYDKDSGHNKTVASNKSILEFVEKHEELIEIVTFCHNEIYYKFRFIPLSTLGMIYFVLAKKNQLKCDEFFHKLAEGVDLGVTNPIRHLREKLIKDSSNKTKLKARDKAALMIYTWNNFLQNKKVTQLLLPRNYTFPKPI